MNKKTKAQADGLLQEYTGLLQNRMKAGKRLINPETFLRRRGAWRKREYYRAIRFILRAMWGIYQMEKDYRQFVRACPRVSVEMIFDVSRSARSSSKK